MAETIVFKDSTFNEGARLAIKHRLFEPGWLLLPTLQGLIKKKNHNAKLSLVFVSTVPVSVALLCYDLCYDELMCFTSKAHRRQGHGQSAVKAIYRIDSPTGIVIANEGSEGSIQFWSKFDFVDRIYS